MKSIKTNFKKLKPAGVRQLAIDVHTGLTGNAYVTTPNPTLVNLQTGITNSVNANNAYEAGKANQVSLKEARDAADAALEALLRTEAATCEAACGGDPVKLASTNFPLRSDASPVGIPAQVTNLKVAASELDGTLKASWKKVHGAVSYEIQTAADADGPWASKESVTITRGVLLNSFTSGQRIWTRVRAFGASGNGAWSSTVSKIVP